MSIRLLRAQQQLLLTVDLTFNLETIETDNGRVFKIALPISNEKPVRGKRAKLPIIDDRFMDEEEFEKIIDEFIKIPLN